MEPTPTTSGNHDVNYVGTATASGVDVHRPEELPGEEVLKAPKTHSLLANKCLSVVFPAVSDVTMGLRIP